jgi:CRP/FNR family transcriptional regulator, anaerobic regulatory protein
MDDFEKIRNSLLQFINFPDEVWEEFKSHLIFQKFKKEEPICSEGEVESFIYYLNIGVARSYFLKDGRDYTLDFFFDHDFVTSFTSFLTRKPSLVNIQALEDCETWKISHPYIYELYRKHHSSERLGRLIAEAQFMKRSCKEMQLLSLTAEERYKSLFKKNPALVSKISVKHLSSYLGIHPESLSRIRNKVTSGN